MPCKNRISRWEHSDGYGGGDDGDGVDWLAPFHTRQFGDQEMKALPHQHHQPPIRQGWTSACIGVILTPREILCKQSDSER
jgi:hypothetical protein